MKKRLPLAARKIKNLGKHWPVVRSFFRLLFAMSLINVVLLLNACTSDTGNIDLSKLTVGSSSGNSSLLFQYKLDENSGNSAQDSSGNAKNATIGGGAIWTTGKLGSALNFPAVGYLTIPNNSTFNYFTNNQFTVQAWINPTSTTGTQNILHMNYLIKIEFISGKIRFSVYYNGTWTQVYNSAATIATGTWTHFALVFSGDTKLYINGNLDGTSAAIYTLARNSLCSGYDVIGAESNGCSGSMNSFNGKVDEVFIYGYARSAADISSYYASVP